MNGSVFGIPNKNQFGFTFIELLVVLLIMGIIGSLVMPNLTQRTPRYEREQFIASLNALMQTAVSQTIITHVLHQIHFDLKSHVISIRKHTGTYDKKGDPECKPVISGFGLFTLSIPEQITFKQFFIEGINELAERTKNVQELWFYIVPEGLAQQVTINIFDTQDTVDDKPRHIGLVLNPFLVQFKVYDAFAKP
ncbi:MAG TPA: type II secretion system protein [Candidatus Babeliales bacterium]|jgi:prepilin-type N-terminal cleavage/methylation domain-containing protein|nr:type II secretion system protein [Candidatus Babeliales bacterium]